MPTKTNAQKAAEKAAQDEQAAQAAAAPANAPASDSNAPIQPAGGDPVVAAAVVDENGQVDPNGPQATPVAGIRVGVMDRRQYSNAGEGYQPGNVAPADTFLDLESDKVVTKAPVRGTQLTIKGSPVDPWAARLLSDKKFSG